MHGTRRRSRCALSRFSRRPDDILSVRPEALSRSRRRDAEGRERAGSASGRERQEGKASARSVCRCQGVSGARRQTAGWLDRLRADEQQHGERATHNLRGRGMQRSATSWPFHEMQTACEAPPMQCDAAKACWSNAASACVSGGTTTHGFSTLSLVAAPIRDAEKP